MLKSKYFAYACACALFYAFWQTLGVRRSNTECNTNASNTPATTNASNQAVSLRTIKLLSQHSSTVGFYWAVFFAMLLVPILLLPTLLARAHLARAHLVHHATQPDMPAARRPGRKPHSKNSAPRASAPSSCPSSNRKTSSPNVLAERPCHGGSPSTRDTPGTCSLLTSSPALHKVRPPLGEEGCPGRSRHNKSSALPAYAPSSCPSSTHKPSSSLHHLSERPWHGGSPNTRDTPGTCSLASCPAAS